MSPKDSEIISAAYKKERNRLLGYIRNRVPAGTEAEDILQDVFYQLTAGFNDIRRIGSISAWLYRVAENRITDLFRKRKYRQADFAESIGNDDQGPLTLAEILPAPALMPGDEELRDMIWQIIEMTLDDLPEEQRSVFVENEFEDKSFREISETTGVPVNTLLSRKRYAVIALRQNLKSVYKLLKEK
jgi:RNA polymerase sigma factor (sigma-70 family)